MKALEFHSIVIERDNKESQKKKKKKKNKKKKKKKKNNLDTHNEYPSPIMTITDISGKCDILAY